MTKFNRRNILKATAVGGSGLAALSYSPQPTLAASDWTVNSPSEVSNDNGELSSLKIPSTGFSFSLDYSGLGSGSHSIDFTLEAKLASASSFESVFADSFEVEGDSGTVNEDELSASFPVDLLADTSMSASDFEEVNIGEIASNAVDLRVSFSWSEGEHSASDSSVSQFDVNVKHTADPGLTTSSLTVNDPPAVSNYEGELSSLDLPKGDFSFSLDYSGLGSGSNSINFELEAKLSTSSSFDTVFSESFDVSGESGTVTESKLSTSFPVDLLANTSMSASDFEESNVGETEVTTVDFRVSFSWSDGGYSASDSGTDAFDVNVTHKEDPALTTTSLTVDPLSTFSNDAGEITSLDIYKDDVSFSLDYSSLESGTNSISFELEAKLSSSSSFDTASSESFDVDGESGTVTDSVLSSSFPVDLLAETSMSASDFEEPNAGETEVTTVDVRVSFEWNSGGYSASDSTNDAFDVSVENTSTPMTVIEDFEDGNLNGWTDTGLSSISSVSYNGSYSIRTDQTSGWHWASDTSYSITTDKEYSAWIYSNEWHNNTGVIFMAQQERTSNFPDGYFVNSDGDKFNIWRNNNGGVSKFASTSWSPNTNEWYEFRWTVDSNGNHTASVYDTNGTKLVSVSGSDSTYTSGGLGVQSWNTNFYVDYVTEIES